MKWNKLDVQSTDPSFNFKAVFLGVVEDQGCSPSAVMVVTLERDDDAVVTC
jgi:hypothetical protein